MAACPPTSDAVPIAVVPSENVTDPDGVPAPDETVAANVTVPPSAAGFGLATSTVDVAGGLTTSARFELVLRL